MSLVIWSFFFIKYILICQQNINCFFFSKLLASLMRNYFTKWPSGTSLHNLSKLFDGSTPSFVAVHCFMCSRWRMTVARYRLICLILFSSMLVALTFHNDDNLSYVVVKVSKPVWLNYRNWWIYLLDTVDPLCLLYLSEVMAATNIRLYTDN